MDIFNNLIYSVESFLEGAISNVSYYLSGLSPLWHTAVAFAFILFVLGIFHLSQKCIDSGWRWPTFLLSSALGAVFLLFWLVTLKDLPESMSDWTVKLLSLWASITMFEVTRRNLEYQWVRNIFSFIVEVPLLLTICLAALHLWADIPNLFVWVNVADTFLNMLLCCAAIIAGYFIVSIVWNYVFISFLLPGGSKWSLCLVTFVLFLTVYIRSLDAIEVLNGLNYLFGLLILLFGALFASLNSFGFLGSERCTRCHRLDSMFLGSEDGGYTHNVSHRWVNESDQNIDGYDASDVQRCERVDEIRQHTVYYHECRYCGEEWETSSSRLVHSEVTPVKRTYKYYD